MNKFADPWSKHIASTRKKIPAFFFPSTVFCSPLPPEISIVMLWHGTEGCFFIPELPARWHGWLLFFDISHFNILDLKIFIILKCFILLYFKYRSHGCFNAAENAVHCFKQSAGNRNCIKFPWQPIIFRNIKPYRLFINAKIFLKAY